MKTISKIASVMSNLLKGVIALAIVFSVKHVRMFPISPKAPIIKTRTPENMNLISLKSSSSSGDLPQYSSISKLMSSAFR